MKKQIIMDLEVYPNFFLVGWCDLERASYRALTEKHLDLIDKELKYDVPYFITFNGRHYDLRLLMYALDRYKTSQNILLELKTFSDFIILGTEAVHEGLVDFFGKYKWWPHPNLDLKNVLGGRVCPGLKKLACRLHLAEVEALPINPDTELTEAQKKKIIEYNKVDILNTKRLLDHCKPHLEMRESLSRIYKVDCRSLSDAQIAEKIMASRVGRVESFDDSYPRPINGFLHQFRYETPQFRNFFDRLNNMWVRFKRVYNPAKKKHTFQKVFEEGNETLTSVKIEDIVPAVDFRFGGLHSVHGKKALKGDGAFDVDVASYYPNLILNFNIYPEGVGPQFLKDYRAILERRLEAKKAGRKVEADGLKIVLNSVFGKFNEYYSKLHDPLSGASVCLHGECGILRLMDLCFQNNVEVLLVNTDGIITRQDPARAVKAWEKEMKMTLEVKEIGPYVIKDSNNHILAYKDGSTKVKGIAFAYDQTASRQTNFGVVRRAAVEYLLRGTPPEEAIRACKNIHEFLAAYSRGPSILEVKKATCPSDPGEPVPDLVRYYLGKGDHHLYRRNSRTWTRIADSAGFVMANAVPLEWPHDLNYDKYLEMTRGLLEKL